MKILLTDQVFPDTAVERRLFEEAGHTLIIAGSREDVLAEIVDADAVLNTFAPLPAEVIATMSRAKIIARYGIGVDNIDVAAATSKGIVVTNVPDYCIEEVATHAVSLALALHRKLARADAALREGKWGTAAIKPIHRLSTLRVGLLGYGRIGRVVAATMSTFGCAVSVYDPYAGDIAGVLRLGLDELFATSDVLMLHAPLTEETRGIVNATRLAQLPPGAIVINASRGPLVVLDDLLSALRSGQLGGAALDTFPVEPIDPAIFDNVPNLLLTPHTAYYSEEALAESQLKAATQIIKILAGQAPDYAVNAAR